MAYDDVNTILNPDRIIRDANNSIESERSLGLGWGEATGKVAEVALLFPDRKHELILQETDWRQMRENLERDKNSFSRWPGFFTKRAALMKIIAADEVRIRKTGIEITMRKPLLRHQAPIEPLPQLRK